MIHPKWKRLHEHAPKPTQFLWSQRIPIGAITVLEGDPGTGKSSLLADIGARVTSGAAMPFESCVREPAGVVLLSGEESLDKIACSYHASGGDCSRVVVLGHDAQIALPDGIEELRSAANAVQASFLVIDPVTDFLGVNINHDQAVRRALSPLAALATELQLAVVLVRHLTKSARSKAVYAGGGSIAFAGLARSVLLVGSSPVEPEQYVVTVSKSNVAAPSSVAYKMEHSAEHNAMKIQWNGSVDTRADELLAKHDPDKLSQLEESQLGLYGFLEAGPLKATQAFKLAARQGISRTTLKRAKRILGVKTIKRGFGSEQVWWWCLPQDSSRLRGVKARLLDETCDELFGGNMLSDDINSSHRGSLDPDSTFDPFDNHEEDGPDFDFS